MLRHFTRALLAATAFLALQGSILGGATACVLMEHHPTGTMAMSEMPDMSSMPVGSANEPASEEKAPCAHDTAPPDCAALSVCAGFVEAAVANLDEASAPSTQVRPLIASAPDYLALPPEIPPPRA